MGVKTKILTIFILAIWIIGCGPASLRQGRRYLAKEEYTQALEALTNALNEDPDNPKIHRDLGIAYYNIGQYEQAVDELKKAKQRLKKDSHVVFYLGLTYERLEQYDKAIEEYAKYTQLSRFSPKKREIQERIRWLIRLEAEQWAKKQMEIEDTIPVDNIPDNAVAVTYFKPNNVSEELEPLHKGLTDLLISDLGLVKSLIVVERIKLKEIYEELGLNSTALIDKDAALRMGKLLGANSLVTGAFTGLGDESDDRWRVDPVLGKIKRHETQELEGVEGQLARFIQVEKKLALQILDNLNVPQEEIDKIRDKILKNVPTESLEGFLAYSRGLNYEDRGLYTEATSEFENAISLDPKFNQAKIHLSETQFLSEKIGSPGSEEVSEVPSPLSPLDQFENEWISDTSQEEMTTEVFTTTVASVSKTGGEGAEESAPPGTEPQPKKGEVKVEVLIQW